MPVYAVPEAARLLAVSDDTVRRWVDSGRLAAVPTPAGRQGVDGAELARFLLEVAGPRGAGAGAGDPAATASARNRFRGLVTRVQRDGVMAQVDLQCGPHRVVSLMTREAADELGLEVGVCATASVKATAVTVELSL